MVIVEDVMHGNITNYKKLDFNRLKMIPNDTVDETGLSAFKLTSKK